MKNMNTHFCYFDPRLAFQFQLPIRRSWLDQIGLSYALHSINE